MTLRIATRKSRLALWQTEYVAQQLRAQHPDIDVQFVPISTTGDQITDRALADIGGKALFVKNLEQALLDDKADIAVHSLKDVPAELDPRFELISFLTRASAFDAFVSKQYARLEDLPQGATVGTSSPRRQAQLKHYRTDLQPILLRGNVDTRLQKAQGDEYDAILLAEAGLQRLGYTEHIKQTLSTEICLPAAGQGIIAIEALSGRNDLQTTLQVLDDADSRACALAEQALVRSLHGNCHSPIGAFATVKNQGLILHGRVLDPSGTHCLNIQKSGSIEQAAKLGQATAQALLSQGAAELLK